MVTADVANKHEKFVLHYIEPCVNVLFYVGNVGIDCSFLNFSIVSIFLVGFLPCCINNINFVHDCRTKDVKACASILVTQEQC